METNTNEPKGGGPSQAVVSGRKGRFSNLGRKKVLLLFVATLVLGAMAWYLVVKFSGDNQAPPIERKEATISEEELKRVEQEVASQGEIQAVSDTDITIKVGDQPLKLQLAETTAYATGNNGMDGNRSDLKAGKQVVFSYNRDSKVLLYITFTEGQAN